MGFRLTSSFLVLSFALLSAHAQSTTSYDSLVQEGNRQLQAGDLSDALSTANRALALDHGRWQAYALSGGALMNLKRYEEAADAFSKAIDHAPTTKQASLRDLRKQCVLAEAQAATPISTTPTQAAPTATQSEVVLWKSIENSTNESDFEGYLKQYPNGTFATLAQGRIDQIKRDDDVRAAQQAAAAKNARRNAIVVVKVEHDHDAGVGNLFTAGATIGQCYGELDLGQHTIAYKTGGSHAFSASCSEMSDLELKSKYGKNNMVHMVVNGKKYNFFSHDDPHSAQDIIDLIHNMCNSN